MLPPSDHHQAPPGIQGGDKGSPDAAEFRRRVREAVPNVTDENIDRALMNSLGDYPITRDITVLLANVIGALRGGQ